MEKSSQEIAYPSLEQVVDVNRQIIDLSGGLFSPPRNLQNENSLIYILKSIENPLFGDILYQDIKDKAASLAFTIIKSHVFNDGNKRTAIHIAWEFLAANSIDVYLDSSVEDVAVGISKNELTKEDLHDWLHAHQ